MIGIITILINVCLTVGVACGLMGNPALLMTMPCICSLWSQGILISSSWHFLRNNNNKVWHFSILSFAHLPSHLVSYCSCCAMTHVAVKWFSTCSMLSWTCVWECAARCQLGYSPQSRHISEFGTRQTGLCIGLLIDKTWGTLFQRNTDLLIRPLSASSDWTRGLNCSWIAERCSGWRTVAESWEKAFHVRAACQISTTAPVQIWRWGQQETPAGLGKHQGLRKQLSNFYWCESTMIHTARHCIQTMATILQYYQDVS